MAARIRPLSILLQNSRSSITQGFLPSSTSIQQARHASVLGTLRDLPGSRSKAIRRGRGPASGKGKTSGRGHKGQGQHGKVPAGFNGGQTPAEIAQGLPKGVPNPFKEDIVKLNLDRVQSWIDQGRLNPYKPITLKELHESNCVSRVGDGIKLLARGKEHLKIPIHIVCSKASAEAIAAVEIAGGTITTRYYTKFAIANILNGKTHPIHSRLFKPTPITQLAAPEDQQFQYELPDPAGRKQLEYYRDRAKRGYLSYQVPEGHTPSLYFRTPGTGIMKAPKSAEKQQLSVTNNKMW